jgi:hypothetical protein
MADRTFLENQGLILLKRAVSLYPVVNVGAAGAVTLQKRTFSAAGTGGVTPKSSLGAAPTSGVGYAQGDGFGVKSVVRNSTGNWTLTLQDRYQFLIQVSCQFANSGAAFNAPLMVVDSNTANTNVATGSGVGTGGKITVQFYNGSGSATDPGNGDQAQFIIVLGDATEP